MGKMLAPDEIKAIRAKLGLGQAAFATKIGVNLRTYQRWEEGANAPVGMSLTALRRWAKKAGESR